MARSAASSIPSPKGLAAPVRRILEDTMKIQKAKNYKGPRKIKIEDTRWAEVIRARLKELE